MAGGGEHLCPGRRWRCLEEGDGQEGSPACLRFMGRCPGLKPDMQGVMLEETSCTDRVVPTKGSWSFWKPLVAALQLVSGPRCCLACTVDHERLSSPTLGCLGSAVSFCSLKSLHCLLQSIFLQKRAQRLEITRPVAAHASRFPEV